MIDTAVNDVSASNGGTSAAGDASASLPADPNQSASQMDAEEFHLRAAETDDSL